MPLNINNIKQASPKANQVATEQYVDTSVANIDISNTLNTNNNVFAQRLGYLGTDTKSAYQVMVEAAESGQTIINGGYLRGELIEANSINAGQIDAYAITGKHISGGTIKGTQIIGSVIKGSYIDLTTTLALTNWQYYTPITIPVGYEQNFAHTNEGDLVVDSQGYVRLAGQQNFIIPSIVQNGTISGSSTLLLDKVYELYSWDSYTIDTLQRSIRQDTSFTSTVELVFRGSGGYSGYEGNKVYNSNYTFKFLDKEISVYVGASGNNSNVAAISSISFNGLVVAYANGSLGSGLDRPWDSGWLDFSTIIKGVPITIKTTIDGGGGTTFEFKALLSGNTPIINHSSGDLISIGSIEQSGTAYIKNLSYYINYPSIWVQ